MYLGMHTRVFSLSLGVVIDMIICGVFVTTTNVFQYPGTVPGIPVPQGTIYPVGYNNMRFIQHK